MTIIFLTRRFYPLIGGVEIHSLEVAKRLEQLGHKVIVITENYKKQGLEGVESSDLKDIDGIEVRRINPGGDGWFKKFRIWREIWKLRSLLNKADVIHCHDVFFWYLPFRFFYLSKKVYITFHGYEAKFPIAKKAIIVRRISEVLSFGNICIGDYISKWYGTKPDYVAYGGVYQIKNEKSNIKNTNKKLKIVLIGRLEQDIGVRTYIKALEKLREDKIDFSFRVYGEGALTKKVEKYGKVSGFTDNIYQVMKASDIIFASSYLTILQALAVKKIVIAVYENPLKEDYLKLSPFSRYIYICKNAKEIANVIESVRNTPWKSNSMTEGGLLWTKEQTWNRVAEIYLSLWKVTSKLN